MCHPVSCVFLSFRPFCRRASQTCLREQENGEQHVTDLCTTVDSMLHLHQTLVLCFWCFLLLHKQVVADEEAGWGPTSSSENPPEKKTSWFWSPLSNLPSLSSLSLSIPFYGSSNSNNKAAALTTTAEGLTNASETTTDHLQDSGSGEVNNSEASKPPTASTQGLLASVTKIRTESPPTGTSDSPQSSKAQRDNDSLVSDSYSHTSSSITNTLFTNSPTSTNAPEQNATHTHPPRGTARAAVPSMGVTARHLPEEHTDEGKSEDFTNKISSTTAPETTVPTALTWAAAQTTTTNPGLVETTLNRRHFLVHVTPSTSLETTVVREPQDSAVSTTLHSGEAIITENHPIQSEAYLGFSETRLGPMEEHLGVITTAMGIDHKLVLESTTSTTQSQRVNFPIAGGKQS